MSILDRNALLRQYNAFTDPMGRAIKAIFGDPLDGAGTMPATTGLTVAEYGNDVSGRKTVLTCSSVTVTISDDAGVAQYGGVQVYDFPLGLIWIKGAVVSGTLTAGVTGTITDNWEGDVALGTVTATTGATLVSTEATILQSTSVVAGASDKIGVVSAFPVATQVTESGSRHIDGTVTAADCFLNFVIDDNMTHTAGTATFTGTITLFWQNLTSL